MALTPLDFPASPTVGQIYPTPPVSGQPLYKWDGSVWLAFDDAQPAPEAPTTYAKKNYIINGAMQVSQENGTTAGTAYNYFPVDMFCAAYGVLGITASQVAVPAPSGSPTRTRWVVTTAKPTVAAGDYSTLFTCIEGVRMADLKFGYANAKTVTLQFGVKAPAGTYCISFLNDVENRVYIAEYNIAPGEANLDTFKSVTIPGDTAGVWPTNTGVGLRIRWTFMAGATYHQAAGAWGGTSSAFSSSNQFNFMGTIGNTFELFDVSLTEGTVAPPFQVPDYASELQLCRRYYAKYNSFYIQSSIATAGGQFCYANYQYATRMRSAPTASGTATGGNSSAPIYAPGLDGCRIDISSGAAGVFYMVIDPIIFNARL